MAYTEIKVPKAADQEFVITVTDEAGLTINLSAFDTVILFLYFKNKTILQKYQPGAPLGFNALTISGASNNELSFRLLTEDTKLAKESIVYYEVVTNIADSDSTDDLTDNKIVTDQYLCTLTDSIYSRYLIETGS